MKRNEKTAFVDAGMGNMRENMKQYVGIVIQYKVFLLKCLKDKIIKSKNIKKKGRDFLLRYHYILQVVFYAFILLTHYLIYFHLFNGFFFLEFLECHFLLIT